MRPMEPDTLIKPITYDPDVEDPVSESEDESSDDEEDAESSGDEAIYTHTRA